eukprot:scaffold2944_cov155-Skeletonema_dohrnii-CCMP3373.AAC.57
MTKCEITHNQPGSRHIPHSAARVINRPGLQDNLKGRIAEEVSFDFDPLLTIFQVSDYRRPITALFDASSVKNSPVVIFIDSLLTLSRSILNRLSHPLKLTAVEIVLFNSRQIGDLIGLVLTENKAYKGCHTRIDHRTS